MSNIANRYSILLDRLQVLYNNENIGEDCIELLNFIAGLMVELDGGLKNAKLTETRHIDKLKLLIVYGDLDKTEEQL